MTGFNVDLAALDQAGQAISQTMHDMKTCSVDRIDGGSGQYGHDGLHEAFEHFCDRWQYGVEVLIEDGDKIAKALNASLDAYIDVDQSAEQSMRATGSGADPAAEVADG
ncbi:hypothetical protein [Actinokineospora xionganensis]|uniref:Excreted virulence factor EspC (Type VII ESX diderm) n=1 Tax=Actinokineospora xionganensis TaxID=2684470 RepID=A0ABR7L3J1_9PSEU|nr:hypothetical protein [Actinokineospora xionganensis]MBC6447147.1 hypothetical protein [Actinokineospora xionganensis]